MKILWLGAAALIIADIAYAHGGGLNSAGCHNNRKTGGYHCHRSSYTPKAPTRSARSNYSGRTSARQSPSAFASSFTLASPDEIYTAQTLLKRAGCGISEVDGKFGPKTKTAIERFQRAQNLTVTGDVDDRLITNLVKLIDLKNACY